MIKDKLLLTTIYLLDEKCHKAYYLLGKTQLGLA